ncbi:N-acetyltransferase [Deltaproteobacteria bacterium Smac51]|nr:N-acetyltransferase [Deltaproteobacteria bacterium Smac51]
MKLSLRPFTASDMPLMESWLKAAHVRPWFGEPEGWLAEIRNADGRIEAISHFIAEVECRPVGFAQYYDCFRFRGGYPWDNEPEGVFGLDFMIGEADFIGLGLGRRLVGLISELASQETGAVSLFADPDPGNVVSVKSLLANGFILDEKTGLYRKNV